MKRCGYPEWYTQDWATLEDRALLYQQMLHASLPPDLDAHMLSLKTALVVALAAQIKQAFPALEVETHPGGPDLYDYLVTLE